MVEDMRNEASRLGKNWASAVSSQGNSHSLNSIQYIHYRNFTWLINLLLYP